MDLQITGVVQSVEKLELTSKTDATKSFRQSILTIDTRAKFNNILKFVCYEKDSKFITDGLKTGQTVTVQFNIVQKEYKDNTFTTLQAWRITLNDALKKEPSKSSSSSSMDEENDLPF